MKKIIELFKEHNFRTECQKCQKEGPGEWFWTTITPRCEDEGKKDMRITLKFFLCEACIDDIRDHNVKRNKFGDIICDAEMNACGGY